MRPTPLRAAAAAVLIAVLAACSEDADSSDSTSAATPSAGATSASASSSAEPTSDEPTSAEPTSAAPTSEEPGSTATTETVTPPSRPARLVDALLPGADVPVDASGRKWTAGALSRDDDVETASACQRAPLFSIGVTAVRQRRYDNGSTGDALHTVAAFADDDSARRAYAVLEAWLRDCAATLREQGRRPGTVPDGLSPVDAPDPAGWAVVLSRAAGGGPRTGAIEAHTVVVDDETLSWLVYRSAGQDYNYEAGQSPPELAAPMMAQRLQAVR